MTGQELSLQIRNEIAARGPISFARFMEMALYAPRLGYYERQQAIGRGGDFFTSVSVGPVFGELLAFQFAEWFASQQNGEGLRIIEAGAHDGTLAADILRWVRQWRPEIFERLEYCLIESSATRRQWQEQTLRDWGGKIKWFDSIPGEPKGFQIIFGNELLDAMPVHRLAWSAAKKNWRECCVGFENGAFVWSFPETQEKVLTHLPAVGPELAAILPDGYIMEVSPAATGWWKAAAEILRRGKLLTIDYGFSAGESLRPERTGGTLRAYSRHRQGADVLAHPGECDITAHVNFSAIADAGIDAGLVTEVFTEQGRYLTQLFAQTEACPGRFPSWTPSRLRQFQTLTHPEHLGHKFRVLLQSRP